MTSFDGREGAGRINIDRVTVIGDDDAVRQLPLGNAPVLPPVWRTLLDRRLRTALLAVASGPQAFAPAAAAQLLYRLPWVAFLRDGDAEVSARVRSLRRASAVIAPASVRTTVARFAPDARFVELDDADRVAAVLEDIGLPPEARPETSRTLGPLLVSAWLFIDDRLTRSAIRLVALTGKSPQPMHPHHLLDDAFHRWYLGEIGVHDRVIDVGCANGAHTLHVARRASHAVGIDVDAAEIAQARARAETDAVSNVEFHVADLTDPDALATLEAESFDVALALDVLEHLIDRDLLLRALHGLLAPSGRLLVAVPNVETTYKRWRRRLGGTVYSNPDHKIEYDEQTLRGELQRAGFRLDRLEYGGFDTPFHGLGALLGAISLPLYRRLTARRHRIAGLRPEKASAFRVIATREPGGLAAEARSHLKLGDDERKAEASAGERHDVEETLRSK